MKKLLILSGKGGTGKTTIASSLIKLGQVQAFADCDVDAPNLALVTGQDQEPETRPYLGMDKAQIDPDLCIDCGLCMDKCRFGAIERGAGGPQVQAYSCEGCGFCERLCSQGAISMVDNQAGELQLYRNGRVFSTARLQMGQGNSGLLVTEVKKELEGLDTDLAIIDGSPGIGCPVIASLRGVDLVLIVAEPSLSGINDLVRIVETARTMDTDIQVLVNKYDTSLENTRRIEEYCQSEGLDLVGRLAFDRQVVEAVNRGETLADLDGQGTKDLVEIYQKILARLEL